MDSPDLESLEPGWGVYRKIAPAAVPRRAEQIAALVALVPSGAERIVELGCGEGYLSEVILDCISAARVIALDGSPAMRVAASARLARFQDRATVATFDLHDSTWLGLVDGADAVVSSLALHHLDDDGKRALFHSLGRRLSPSGALLIADLVHPQREEARELFAATWDASARAQSIAETGSSELFDLFVDEQWNHYRYPDPIDTPSPLFAQLEMLMKSGFAIADCFWMSAGHAIYGGYKDEESGEPAASFESALAAAQRALGRG